MVRNYNTQLQSYHGKYRQSYDRNSCLKHEWAKWSIKGFVMKLSKALTSSTRIECHDK